MTVLVEWAMSGYGQAGSFERRRSRCSCNATYDLAILTV
jgi:hypothetical protein